MVNNSLVSDLCLEKEKIMLKIKEINKEHIDIESESNSNLILELRIKELSLLNEKDRLNQRLVNIEEELGKINKEVEELSTETVDIILKAMEEQRWYFFRNKPTILMDRDTGILWANLDFFYNAINVEHKIDQCYKIIESLKLDDIDQWRIPEIEEVKKLVEDKSFPFLEGENYNIKNIRYYHCISRWNGGINLTDLKPTSFSSEKGEYGILPRSHKYLNEYDKNISVYRGKELFKCILNIFINNKLEPIFDDDRITKLYRDLYIKRPDLINKVNELDMKINSLSIKEELPTQSSLKDIVRNFKFKNKY